MLDRDEVVNLVESGGAISKALRDFEVRAEQKGMLGDIVDAYNEGKTALIEAGTGTGKSMAYLIPALLWASQEKERTVISTRTINLQEQLMGKDIPFLLKALGLDLRATIVKGMNNYVCLRKLDDVQDELQLFEDSEAGEIEKIKAWVDKTKDGTRSDLSFVPSYNTWERVGAEGDACNPGQCKLAGDCFFLKARREATKAQVLVVNHSMLFTDLAQRASNEGSRDSGVLPDYGKVILDEAHHIEDVATEHFADKVSRLQLLRLVARLASEGKKKATGKLVVLRSKLQSSFTLSHTIWPVKKEGMRHQA